MTTLAKHCWHKSNPLLALILALALALCGGAAQAAANTSPLYIELSDAMSAVKQNDRARATPHLQALKQTFAALDNHDSPAGQKVSAALDAALARPDAASLESLSRALYTFEKEQNPVDYAAARQAFAKRVMPVYDQLHDAVVAHNLEDAQTIYKRFNSTWTLNEKIVRETSLGHYGQIENAMAFLRVAMLAEPPNYPEMEKQAQLLGDALNDFKAGNTLQPQVAANAPQTLPDGINLLEQALTALQNGDSASASSDIGTFIQQWPIFEGDVQTRDGALYARVESELPVIMSKGSEPANIARLQTLVSDLKAIDISASYGIIGAIALQRLFPTLAVAGTNREILEGAVGIVAVIMMLFIGAWLHSKSSIEGWKKFVDKQVAQALATGSLVSMMLLSFLAVFREGAETILFYVGMLPQITTGDLLAGIGLAVALLAVIAVLMNQGSLRLPMHLMFKVMTWLIYALGFKILGVSIHALQLTQILPTHAVSALPSLPNIGFYPNWESIAAQALYLTLIPAIGRLFRHKH